VRAANSDLTTTITQYLAVFNLSEWFTGRNVWYPLTLEVPVAAGWDLSLGNDSYVGVVVIKETEYSQFPSVGQNFLRVPCHYAYNFFPSSWPPRGLKRCFNAVFGLYC
jgi:hypothetical protein